MHSVIEDLYEAAIKDKEEDAEFVLQSMVDECYQLIKGKGLKIDVDDLHAIVDGVVQDCDWDLLFSLTTLNEVGGREYPKIDGPICLFHMLQMVVGDVVFDRLKNRLLQPN